MILAVDGVVDARTDVQTMLNEVPHFEAFEITCVCFIARGADGPFYGFIAAAVTWTLPRDEGSLCHRRSVCFGVLMCAGLGVFALIRMLCPTEGIC